MTTTIRDTINTEDYTTIGPQYRSVTEVRVTVRQREVSRVSVVDRAEFLAAVAAELDVVIIPRADLPPVDTSDGVHVNTRFGLQGWSATILRLLEDEDVDVAERAREYALAYLALAEHLEANPPVDEAQVAALAELLNDLALDGTVSTHDYARRLVQAGVRAPEREEEEK